MSSMHEAGQACNNCGTAIPPPALREPANADANPVDAPANPDRPLDLADFERDRGFIDEAPLEDLPTASLIARLAFDPSYTNSRKPDTIGELLARLARDLGDSIDHSINAASPGSLTVEWGPTFQHYQRVVETLVELRRRELAERVGGAS